LIRGLFLFISKISTTRPKTVIFNSILLTLLMGFFAGGLNLELSWVSLAPKDDPSVEEFQQIMNDFPSMNNIMVLVTAENEEDLDSAVQRAENKLQSLDKYVKSVHSRVDSSFMIENGLLLMDEEMIEAMGFALSDANMAAFLANRNKGLEMELQALESMDIDDPSNRNEIMEKEDVMTSNLLGMNSFYHTLQATLDSKENNGDMDGFSEGIHRLMLGDPYFRSNDGRLALMTIQPAFDILDYELLTPGVNTIIENLDDLEKQLTGVNYEITGMHVVGKDEMASVESDSYITMLIGILFILALLYFAFRMFSAPILAFIPLLFGVLWDTGLTAIIIGRLNLLTAFTAIMLIGLGIDFSIHLLSGFTEARSKGKTSVEAVKHTLVHIGPSILTGAMTTAAAFLTLTISSLEVLSELGFVMGMGIITTVIAVFFVLPSILVLVKGKEKRMMAVKGEYRIIGKAAGFIHQYKIIAAILILLLAGIAGWHGQSEFDLNMMNLEPEGLESIRIMNKMVDAFGMSTEGLMVEKNNLEDIKRLSSKLKKEETVSSVVSIADFIPSKEEQAKRLDKIKEVKASLAYQPKYHRLSREKLLQELETFQFNVKKLTSIYEQAGSEEVRYAGKELLSNVTNLISQVENQTISEEKLQEVSKYFYDHVKAISQSMMTEDLLTIADLPDNLKKQFVSEDESKFLLTVYPNFEIWENLGKEKGKAFIDMVRDQDPSFTGTTIFMRVMYESAKAEVVQAGILVLITLFLILFIHFKSIKYTLLAFTPLLFTLLFTVGAMGLLDLKWNILNILAIPLIIGIGIDDGVHILHRYISTEDSIFDVFSSVGRAILITTLTTMAGFGSLIFSSYRGMAYLGEILFIGVGFAFIMTIVILPILIKDRRKKGLR